MPNRATVLLSAALLGLALAWAPASAAPPAGRSAALADLKAGDPARRAEAIVWLAEHGTAKDDKLLYPRLRDESDRVREDAESALWALWSRSGDPALDALLARGAEQMDDGSLRRAIATFSEIIRKKPSFTEAWNKRATAYYLAGRYNKSIADCEQVLKRNPRHFGALSGLGQIYLALGNDARALKWFRRALAVNPNLAGVALTIKALEDKLERRRERMI